MKIHASRPLPTFALFLTLLLGLAGVVVAAPPDAASGPPPASAPASQGKDDATQPDSQPPGDADLPLDELRAFAEVFTRIKSDYVEAVDDRTLLNSAIRGMLSGLDPHSSYLDNEAFKELQVGTQGEFGGLGIEVGMEDGFVKVIAPIDDSPAQRAGLQAGDTIVRIDRKPARGLSLGEAVKLMRGAPGTQIQLGILRSTGTPVFEVTITRDIIQVASVRGRMLEPGYGYVRISHFQSRTGDDLAKSIDALATGGAGPLKGLVLDLRNNPGGVLNSAVSVSDAFLTSGLIVYTQGRQADSRIDFAAGPDDILDGAPIVVLVNGGSASASEIVAGALQDRKRAIVMGTPTFGKGSVQTIVPIDDSTALKLTTARYFTPSGRSIQAQGIVPDIVLERGEFKPLTEPGAHQTREADLMRHLDEEPPADGGDPTASVPLALEDFQLAEALNVLKGINILGHRPNP